ncbi:hypothetical protein RhiirC2_802489 [Rhizophagus irregularis]|uniref:Uncharacterized protein n=1 Tax=Rhizophagus irregularis TaxID=588596 RepID=A0A2N1M196_9GLOM|nr:hypothetical protein RhiirC2_802489 [Rhizophagus irregularis]
MCDEIIRKKSNNIVYILIGDFNLITNGLINSYRKLNKEELENTYHKEGVSTRINQIWISETYSNKLLNFSITPLTFITSSDYDIITLTMDTSALI